jgi:hypothetical protein
MRYEKGAHAPSHSPKDPRRPVSRFFVVGRIMNMAAAKTMAPFMRKVLLFTPL